jgi:hypothetical protein
MFELTVNGNHAQSSLCSFWMANLPRDLGNAMAAEGFKPLVARNDGEVRRLPESPSRHSVLAT